MYVCTQGEPILVCNRIASRAMHTYMTLCICIWIHTLVCGASGVHAFREAFREASVRHLGCLSSPAKGVSAMCVYVQRADMDAATDVYTHTHIYIYIYIYYTISISIDLSLSLSLYIYVCVCGCACINTPTTHVCKESEICSGTVEPCLWCLHGACSTSGGTRFP